MAGDLFKADIVVVGAGLLGSSAAMHLSELGDRSVVVLDIDLEGGYSSSELNAGGVRATWNHPVNALLSKFSIDYYSRVRDAIGFRQKGYFWMYSKSDWPKASATLRKNPNLKDSKIEYLDPVEITKRFDFIDKTDDLGGATFSPYDGLLNANLLKMHYREKAKARGVEFVNRAWVYRVEIAPSGKIILDAWVWPEILSDGELRKILTSKDVQAAKSVRWETNILVNCSGAWAKRFAEFMGTESPCQAIRRQVSVFDCKEVDLTPYGMFVDPSGVYFHPEANYILSGYAIAQEREGYNFEYDGESFFEQYIWPALYERSTKFESLKHVTGWAGLYEVSPDKSGIIGSVAGYKNIFEAHSFSGRGAMQSYGAGLGLAEWILKNRFETIDLSSMAGSRFSEGRPISEDLLI